MRKPETRALCSCSYVPFTTGYNKNRKNKIVGSTIFNGQTASSKTREKNSFISSPNSTIPVLPLKSQSKTNINPLQVVFGVARMEKSHAHPPEKSRSFAGRSTDNIGLDASDNAADPGSAISTGEIQGRERVDITSLGIDVGKINLNQVCQEIDALSNGMSKDDDPSTLDLPESVEVFLGLVEGLIGKFDCGDGENSTQLGNADDEDVEFFNALNSLSKLTNALGTYPSHSAEMTTALDRASCAQQRAMTFLEEEFRAFLGHSMKHDSDREKKIKSTTSFKRESDESDRCVLPEANGSGSGEDEYPGYSPGAVMSMSRITHAMILSGYETECSQVYGVARRSAFKEALAKLGFEGISIDDLQRMPWESLEGEVNTWIRVVQKSATFHLPAERKLFDSVYTNYPYMWNELFGTLSQSAGIRFLDFAGAVAMTKRSPEKLFKFIDMYETIRDNLPKIISHFELNESTEELKTETASALNRIGEVIVNIFSELENSIKSDAGKQPVPSGTVHPLTRYTINYLGYTCEYWNTLDQVFKEHEKHQDEESSTNPVENNGHNGGAAASPSPFLKQIGRMMDLLDANLSAKSKLYRDPSLRDIFLMNNGRYILQKMKGVSQVYQMMGEIWGRKRSSELRQYHKSYQRETWGKVLGCLSHEGLQVNGKVNKPALKERFKTFNNMFDDIHRTQSTWVVSDTQLQSELRISVSSVVVPAYRSFLGRFGQCLESGRQTEKYIKYQPDDIQTSIDELFDGNPNSMGRRR
uniref:Exocyst subunit Exo70 family protein n=1 Tax=Kalanchoe fedtschenkoi TaxID=63787 RepID=A0A7N0TM13_KALFE